MRKKWWDTPLIRLPPSLVRGCFRPTHGTTAAIFAVSSDLIGLLRVDPRWPHERWRRPARYIVSHQHSSNYSLLLLSLSLRTRPQPRASSQSYEGTSLLTRAFLPLYLFLATAKVETPGCNDCDTASNGNEAMYMLLAAPSPRTICPIVTLPPRDQRYIQRDFSPRAFRRPQLPLHAPVLLPG